jgi:hypothetical protein
MVQPPFYFKAKAIGVSVKEPSGKKYESNNSIPIPFKKQTKIDSSHQKNPFKIFSKCWHLFQTPPLASLYEVLCFTITEKMHKTLFSLNCLKYEIHLEY